MTDFVDVPKDTLLLWLREQKAIYAPIPAKLNRNKEELSVKAIFVETENKFAPFLVCGDCEKVFCWYKQQSGGKWIYLSGLSTVKLHQRTTSLKAKSTSSTACTTLINRALEVAERDVRKRKSLPANERKLAR